MLYRIFLERNAEKDFRRLPKEIIDYVEGELKKGEQKDAIKARLLQNGWSGEDIKETFGLVGSKIGSAENIPQKTYRNRKEKIHDFIFGLLILMPNIFLGL